MPTASSKSTAEPETQDGSARRVHPPRMFDSELFLFTAGTRAELITRIDEMAAHLGRPGPARLQDLAYTASRAYEPGGECLSVIASGHEDLAAKLAKARASLEERPEAPLHDRSGIYRFPEKLGEARRVFLFPGENAQYVNMLRDLCLNFPEMRRAFDESDAALQDVRGSFRPSALAFPPPGAAGGEEEMAAWERAVVLIHTANEAMRRLMDGLRLRPDAILGHSFGEMSALEMAGVLHGGEGDDRVRYGRDAFLHITDLAFERDLPTGRLLAVGGAERSQLEPLLAKYPDSLQIAMENCPHQWVLCAAGPDQDAVIADVDRTLSAEGALCAPLPIRRPYHTRFFEPAFPYERAYVEKMGVKPPEIEVWSCATASPFPHDQEGIIEATARHWMSPVLFQTTIENMYEQGFRVFVDVGPRGNLCAFVSDILKDRPHLAVPLNRQRRGGILQLNHALGILAAHGVPFSVEHLHERWGSRKVALGDTEGQAKGKPKVIVPLPIALPQMKADGIPKLSARREIASGVPAPSAAGSGPAQSSEGGATPSAAAPPVTHASTAPRHEPAARPPGPAPSASVSPVASPSPSMEETAAPDPGEASSAMMAYLETMDRFLEVQRSVLGPLFDSAPVAVPSVEQAEGGPRRDAPLLGRIDEETPGRSLTSVRVFDVEEDLYLGDHALGTTISTSDPDLRPLPVMPLLMSLEMVAEAGARLFPAKRVVAIEEIRANRWILFTDGKATLRTEGRLTGLDSAGARVRVAIHQEDLVGPPNRPPMVEATAVLADAYPSPPASRVSPLPETARIDWPQHEVYPRRTFHGPRFQGIRSITHLSGEGLDGTLEVLPRDGLLRSNPGAEWVYDPLLVDSMGQAVWLWGSREPFGGTCWLPFGVGALRFYGPNLEPGTPLAFRLRVRSNREQVVQTDLEAVDGEGRVRTAIETLSDREFPLSRRLHRLMLEPVPQSFADVGELPAPLPGAGRVLLATVEDFPSAVLEGSFGVWRHALAFLVLNPPEREAWRAMKVPLPREIQWLLGRAAAKDVVRHLLQEKAGHRYASTDIRLDRGASGRPEVVGGWKCELPLHPAVSIAHTEGMVAAAASAEPCRLGIDTERIRPLSRDFLDGGFSAGEMAVIPGGTDEAARNEWILRAWCAKEAVGKALGSGVPYNPRELSVERCDPATGTVTLLARGATLAAAGAPEGSELAAVTFRRGDHVFAAAALPPG